MDGVFINHRRRYWKALIQLVQMLNYDKIIVTGDVTSRLYDSTSRGTDSAWRQCDVSDCAPLWNAVMLIEAAPDIHVI